MPLRFGRVRVSWYRWRLSLPLLLCVVLFAWSAWTSLTGDDEFSLSVRLPTGVTCAALAVLFAWFQWRDRHPMRSGATRRERERESRDYSVKLETPNGSDPRSLRGSESGALNGSDA